LSFCTSGRSANLAETSAEKIHHQPTSITTAHSHCLILFVTSMLSPPPMKYYNKFHKRMVEYIATIPGPTPERTAAAKLLFTKIGMDHNSDRQIFEEDVDRLNTYPDVIDGETFDKWVDELGGNAKGFQWEYGKISFKHAILPPHYQVAKVFWGFVGMQIPRDSDSNAPPKNGWTLKAYGPDDSDWDVLSQVGGEDYRPGHIRILHLR
jgi:hypothetical protein